MPTPTADQVRTLAPDASAARAGEGLADPRRWSATGRTAEAAWGLCQGSGSSPYQTAVELGGPAYRCSCPSRKIPCKHALALLFLLADGVVPPADPPGWTAEWLAARVTRTATAGSSKAAAEVDPAARARRIETRERKVVAGIDELDRWLADLVRRGLDGARGEGYRFWDGMAARLVDAQAAGLARSVRALGWAANAGTAWPDLVLEGAARLHLLCEAYRRSSELPEALRADVRALVGWTTREEDLDPAADVEDRWLVVGRRVEDSGQIMTARTFLLGEATGRAALHLAFGVGEAPPTVLALPGQAFRARLAFYPSATPIRAAVRPMLVPDGEVTALPGGATVAAALHAHAERLARNPFVDAWPVVLAAVLPVLRDGRLLAREADGSALVGGPIAAAPRLLAVSGGRPVTLVGEWDGSVLRPLSVLADGRLVGLEAGESRAALRDGDPDWSQLVSAVLLGTDRTGGSGAIPEPAAALSRTADPQRALLAAAGVLAVRRRAGRRPLADAGALPAPASDDRRPALRGATARLLGAVLTDERPVLPELLGLVRASGRRLPEEWLPELLALGNADEELGALVGALAGPRAAWLADVLPPLRGPAAFGALPVRDAAWPAAWTAAWESAAGPRDRRALLRTVRRADAAAGRDLLASALPDLPGDQRAAAVEALEVGLGPDDEAILAQALEDRRLDVRRAAAGLLARLDGSALCGLLEARARPLVETRGRNRPSIVVTFPAADTGLEAAGIGEGADAPSGGPGARSARLAQLVAHVRPVRWSEWLRAEPRVLIERALRTDEARPLLAGWIEAAARFSDPAWATALAAEPKVAVTARVDPDLAVAALPPAARGPAVAAIAPSLEPARLAALAATCPAPWADELTDAALAVQQALGDVEYPDQAVYGLTRAASLGVPPRRADDLAQAASHAGVVRPALAGAMETLRLRVRIHEAFAALPPAVP